MHPTRTLVIAALAAGLFTACSDGAAGTSGGDSAASAVASAALEDTGSARIEGDEIVVELSSGPARLVPADDTEFFVCEGDDCEMVDEATFRSQVREGDRIRVLGPNAELLGADAEQLPAQVWVVLDRATG